MEIKLNELNDIFTRALGEPTAITTDTVRDDMAQWDSINHLNLVVELEDFYHVGFTMDEIKDMDSVKKIMETIRQKKL
jgi:acyl carrier protein